MSRLGTIAKLPGALGRTRRLASGGGPSRLRLLGVGRPTGLLLPRSRLRLEIETRDGRTTRWEPEIPLPFPYAWAYRLSRLLGVPLISSHDPENLRLSLRLPRR
jgi:hypothetical protein